ncbi:MAG: ABC transporter permease [Actinobacteria bacterium]|nr:ABC transporter permease [Actinomycetota bacterium]
MSSRSRRLGRVNWPGLLTLALLAGAWEATVRWSLLDYQYLPAPSAIARGARTLLASGELIPNVLHTLMVTLIGWSIASVIGIGLGLLLGLSPTAYRYSMTSFEVTKAIPPITFVPATLLIFGFSLRMELVIVVYVGVWPVLINTIGGVRGVPGELLDLGRMLHMSSWTRVRKLIVPAAVPEILVGLRLGLTLCLVLAVVAEMVGNPAGLGHALVRAQQALQPEKMFAYVLSAGVLGITLNALFRSAASWMLPPPAGGPEGGTP